MRRAALLLSAAVVFACASRPPAPLPGTPEAEVAAAFESYRSALLALDGDEAVQWLSGPTIDWYARMRELALYASADEVRRATAGEQLQILLQRTRVPADRLAAFTTREFVAYSVDQGWFGKNDTVSVELENFRVRGAFAVADARKGRKVQRDAFQFVKEGEDWRVEFLAMIRSTSLQLSLLAEQEKVTEEELIARIVGALNGRAVTPADYEAPLTRP